MTAQIEAREPTLLERMGGVSGLVYASVPTFAYVTVNALAGLHAGVISAIAVGLGLVLLKVFLRGPIQPAISGLIGVIAAGVIAYLTGSANNYFLPGIWISLVMTLVFAVSVMARRPIVGVIWNLMRSAGPDPAWRVDKTVLHAFDVATLTLVAVFASRFLVQQWLYDAGSTGGLAFARIAMGYPLLAVALLVVYWAVRRANRRGVLNEEANERMVSPTVKVRS